MSGEHQHQSDRLGRDRTIQRQDGMGRVPREERPGAFVIEPRPRRRERRRQNPQTEGRHRKGMSRPLRRREKILQKIVEALQERSEDPPIGPGRGGGKLRGRLLDGSVHRHGLPLIERMGQRDLRMDPLESVTPEIQSSQEGRGEPHRVDRGTDVVMEPGQRQLAGPRPTAGFGGTFEDGHRIPLARQSHRGGESVGTRPDDGGVEGCFHQPRKKPPSASSSGAAFTRFVRGEAIRADRSRPRGSLWTCGRCGCRVPRSCGPRQDLRRPCRRRRGRRRATPSPLW